MATHSTADRELSLPEMFTDPIVQAVMARNGVTKQDLEEMIRAVCSRTAFKQVKDNETGRHDPGAIDF